jgi:beta-mannanase
MPGSLTRRLGARSVLPTLTLALGLALSLLAPALPAGAATPSTSKIYLGVAGDLQTMKSRTTSSLASHDYGYFTGKVPSGRMITVRFSDQSWRATANMTSGSAAYQHVVSWADTLKSRSGEVFLAFHHEPESSGSKKFGTAEDYKAAFRKIVTIFRARGANNVIFAWQMTGYAFRAAPGEYNYAATWYPGDQYVDVVGADPYNWYTCGHGRGRWQSLQTLVDPVLAFAKAHGKQVVLPEFASMRESRRPQWIKDAGTYMAAHDNQIAAAFYFNRRPTNSANSDCTWPLSTDADYAAFRQMASNPVFKQ